MLYVIMSVYKNDNVDAVKEALESLRCQTYSDFILYLKYDGPVHPDVEEYISSLPDPRIRVRGRGKNMGLAVSLNELLEEILRQPDCEFVARMDADDYCLPLRFEKQINYLKSHEVDIVGSYIRESRYPTVEEGVLVTYPTGHQGCRLIFGKRTPVAHPAVMFRRSYFDKVGLYPTDTLRAEDDAMWLKGFKGSCTFANIPEVLLHMRVNDDFYNRRNSLTKTKFDYQFRKKIIRELNLPKIDYLYAVGRYLLFRYSPGWLLKFAYGNLRPSK